jgi:hypothetical protein
MRVPYWYGVRHCLLVKFSILATTAPERTEDLRATVRDHRDFLHDRVRGLVATAEMPDLHDPELQSVKRQVRAALVEVAPADLPVREIIIPEWYVTRAN